MILHPRFMLITGTARFAHLNICGWLNNLRNVSMDKEKTILSDTSAAKMRGKAHKIRISQLASLLSLKCICLHCTWARAMKYRNIPEEELKARVGRD